MKALLALIFLLVVAGAPAEEPLVVDMTPEGHSKIVSAYLARIAARDFSPPEFGIVKTKSKAEVNYPLPKFEARGEFEAKDDFNERRFLWETKAARVVELRREFVDNERVKHAAFVTKLKTEIDQQKNSPLANALGIQQDEILFAYATNPPRYNIDTEQFPSMPTPDEDMGIVSYGYAKFDIPVSGASMKCDVETAKAIRALGEANSLLVVASLKNAKIEVLESNIEVKVNKGWRPEIPMLGLAILAEYLNPGSTVGTRIPQKEIIREETLKSYTVKITCSAASYSGFVNARTRKWIGKTP